MDLVQLTRKPPPAPPKCGLCFFSHHCFIVLFQFWDIFFTLKVKKIREKWIRTETPPPHCGLNPSKCFFFFFLTSLIDVWSQCRKRDRGGGKGREGDQLGFGALTENASVVMIDVSSDIAMFFIDKQEKLAGLRPANFLAPAVSWRALWALWIAVWRAVLPLLSKDNPKLIEETEPYIDSWLLHSNIIIIQLIPK